MAIEIEAERGKQELRKTGKGGGVGVGSNGFGNKKRRRTQKKMVGKKKTEEKDLFRRRA